MEYLENLVNHTYLADLKQLINALKTTTTGRRYYNDMVQYVAPDSVVSNCAEISFYNIGTSTMVINGVPFLPFAGIAFDGKAGETDTTKYKLGFSGAGDNIAFVIRKVYV
jgi:hypothetical protein